MKKDQLILYAFRHCYSQTADIVQDMINYLTKSWLKISPEFRELIKKDIQDAIRRDQVHGGCTFGMQFNRTAWISFLREIYDIEEKHIEKQAAHG